MIVEWQREIPQLLQHVCVILTWPNMQSGDEGKIIELANFADRSVQVAGTFGGAKLVIEGSNDGENWAVLTDPQGNDIEIAANKIELITEVVRYARPRVSGGDGSTSLKVVMLVKGDSR